MPYPVLADALRLPHVQAEPVPQREAAARAALLELRRNQCPELRTWTTDDPAPATDTVLAVVDNEGELWRTTPRTGEWHLEEPPGRRGAGATLFGWRELLSEFGPVTEAVGHSDPDHRLEGRAQ
ncbi:hypothetical protein ACJ6WD_41020 [Streptomyces sp. VTCC 41912]|uniref:hypothetical protein n=1 Tax=Streptomyces sp. VTCC 41912 TaxID=3383243 RepID=UPI003896E0A5